MLKEASSVSMCSGDSARSPSRVGMRDMAPSWHEAQCCL
jgi:hypothetical protein